MTEQMTVFRDTIMIRTGSVDRAVVIDVPEGISVNNLQELAEKAWRSVNKEVTNGGVTVRLATKARVKEKFNRRRAEQRFAHIYETANGDRCIYCGMANDGKYDHQPPVYYFTDLQTAD